MFFRDWPCDSQLVTYFNVSAAFVARMGEAAFKAQLFLCSLAQLVNMKNFIEQRRAANFMGNILWQLNDIWPCVSWGTLEYGTQSRGNVVGGRWKPAHYALATLFADTFVACGGDGRCYVRHDGPLAGVAGSVSAALVHTLTGEASPLPLDFPVALPAGVGKLAWLCAAGGNATAEAGCGLLAPALAAAGCGAGGDDCVLSVALTAPSGAVLASNYLLLAAPGALALPPAALVTAAAADAPNPDGSTNVTVATSATAMFVTLTTEAAGRFSANAFHVFGATSGLVVRFLPFEEGGSDPATLDATLRVEHMGEYLTLEAGRAGSF
jgi:beta-mannosidase